MNTKKCKIAVHKPGPSVYGHWENVDAQYLGKTDPLKSALDYPGVECGTVLVDGLKYTIPMEKIIFNQQGDR